jgi:hypothetical protein
MAGLALSSLPETFAPRSAAALFLVSKAYIFVMSVTTHQVLEFDDAAFDSLARATAFLPDRRHSHLCRLKVTDR